MSTLQGEYIADPSEKMKIIIVIIIISWIQLISSHKKQSFDTLKQNSFFQGKFISLVINFYVNKIFGLLYN